MADKIKENVEKFLLSRRNDSVTYVPWILAASASGKTTWCSDRPNVVDGDVIIARATGWPTARKWYEADDAWAQHLANYLMVRGFAAYDSRLIVFNGVVPPNAADVVAIVTPPEAQVAANIASRNRDSPDSYPGTIEEYRNNVRGLLSAHPRARVFTSFDDAAAHVTSSVVDRGYQYAREAETTEAPVETAAAAWVIDEMAEVYRAEAVRDADGVLDGFWDALGTVLALLIARRGDASRSYKAYVDAQVRRGRPIDMPHQRIISVVAGMIAEMSSDDAARTVNMLRWKWRTGKLTGSRFGMKGGRR
jgi:hypothetical protein